MRTPSLHRPSIHGIKKKAGSGLYTHFELDHRKLFKLASECRGDILLTYDNAQEIVGLPVNLICKHVSLR